MLVSNFTRALAICSSGPRIHYPREVEIPLVLRGKEDGSFVYGIPRAYRAVMALVLAILCAALFMDGRSPGATGWIALTVAALAALYEDRWAFDAHSGELGHRAGLVVLARRTRIASGRLARFRIEPFVRGTVPGTADEAEENAAALAGRRADDARKRRAIHKRHYLCLVCETIEGERYFVDAVDARRAGKLRSRAEKMARSCGVPLVDGGR
jgi:hypothetical protein